MSTQTAEITKVEKKCRCGVTDEDLLRAVDDSGTTGYICSLCLESL